VGGVSRKNIARLSLHGAGSVDPLWNPGTDREMVYALSVSGGAVYAAWSFRKLADWLAADGEGEHHRQQCG